MLIGMGPSTNDIFSNVPLDTIINTYYLQVEI